MGKKINGSRIIVLSVIDQKKSGAGPDDLARDIWRAILYQNTTKETGQLNVEIMA